MYRNKIQAYRPKGSTTCRLNLQEKDNLLEQSEFFNTDKVGVTERKSVNVASVPQRSQFRYPGGKTWFILELRRWLAQTRLPHLLVERFAGCAIVSITAVTENLVDHALLVEKDPMVAAVWRTILGGNAFIVKLGLR